MKERKKLKDTKFGQFLNKAKDVIGDKGGDLVDIGVAFATGGPGAAIAQTFNVLKGDNSPEAKQLVRELEREQMNFEREMYELEIKDRDSARTREIEIAKAGGKDVLMLSAGFTALALLIGMTAAVIFTDQTDNPLFHQLMGIIEGVALTIFAYYFGTSKGSKDKQTQLDKLTK